MRLMRLALSLQLIALLGHHAAALIGGEDAARGQFPFQALLRGLYKDPVRSFASGVLVHPEWVLTTAESVADFVSVTVTLGVLRRDSAESWRQDIPALRVHLHPAWPGRAAWKDMHLNDIALVRLSRAARVDDSVQVARLPMSGVRYGLRATVSGWGTHRTDTGYRDQNSLKWENTSTLGLVRCFWKRFGVSEHTGWLRLNHICADTKGSGPCYNDGGAPLMDGRAGVVLGLFTTPTVYSEFCGTDVPSVYTRVASHLEWIRRVSGVSPQ